MSTPPKSPPSKIDKKNAGDCRALWVGPYMRLYGGAELVPQVTEHVLSQPEAEGSDNWKVIESLKDGDS